ncbi:DUF4407 domain-containing protein [Olivibacter sp. XZL3]|uniref:DUF4407 domain-containing protein n=1 Tax=Olivibacter sp. XZL3 TaxID=1735116 RepID=UPI0010659897|nr:DUF4407 domain-containing protein [Olivibacter sp. XZL3]
MRRIKQLFWFCSGAHIPTLLKTPSEHNKYVSIGATIFFTGLFAALAASYALYFVFSGSAYAFSASLVFGALWGLAIFNLDRYIVSTINKSASPFKQVLQATPRLLLAILIGIVISRPLELKIFDKEIKEQLKINYLNGQIQRINKQNRTFSEKYGNELAKLQELKLELNVLSEAIKQDRKNLNFEIFGNKTTETSGIMGYGPYAKRKEESLIAQENRAVDLQKRIDAEERALNGKKQADGLYDEKLLTSIQLDSMVKLAGFADSNAALEQLKYRETGEINESNYWAITFISLLFVFFECLPVLVKLMSAKGPYDALINNEEFVLVYRSDKDRAIEMELLDRAQAIKVDAYLKKIQAELG